MTILGNFIRSIVKILKKLFDGLTEIGKKAIPIAILIVDAIRDLMANPITGSIIDAIIAFVMKAIKGTKNETDPAKIREMLNIWLPKILIEFHATEKILSIADDEERLKALIEWLKGNSPEANNILFHGLAALFAEKLSEGELDWSKSAIALETAYKYPQLLEA